MDLTLGTSGQYQTLQRNAISIESVVNTTLALADFRIIKGLFTQGGVSGELANGYIAVKIKRNGGTGEYLEGPVTFNVTVTDQKGEEKDVTVNVITPIARIHLDRIELPVNETLSLTTKPYVSSPAISWRKIYGPGNFVVTGNTGQFSAPGKYLLRMTAMNGGYATFQEVDINVLTESGDKLTPDEPLPPGEAPETNQILIGKDGRQFLISPDGSVSIKDPITGIITPHEDEVRQFSLVDKNNYSYVDPEGYIFVMKNGTKVDTGVKGKHVSMGVDGFIIAILDDQECLNRGKSLGCLFEYRDNNWHYWGYQKFTGKNSLHQTIEEMRDVFAKDIHVLSKDHIAIVDLNGALFEMSEHETRGKEFWELGGVWRKVKISIHGRIVGIGEDNILKKWYLENWFPISQNIGDFFFEHNGRITTVDFNNQIEKVPELYFASFNKVSAGGNVDLNDISLGQDGLGHMTRLWSNNARTTNYFYKNLAKLTLVNTNIPNTVWKEMNISIANLSKICVAINNSEGVKVYNGIEVSEYEIFTNFQKNVTCSSDNAVMSIITDEKATESEVPKGSALQLVDDKWYPVGGKLVQLDIGSEHFIYGVDNANRVWKKEGKLWKRIPGLMKQISVGVDGSLAGIGTDDFIYLMVEGAWINLDVKAKKVSISINNQLAYIGMDDVAYTNYPNFFIIPIIHDIKKSFIRPRKGVAFRNSNQYRVIHSMGDGATIWEADNLPAGCVNLGQVITENNSPPNFDTRCYDLREEIMKNPVSFEELAILDVPNDIRVYRPVPEAGFSCVSHIAWAGTDPPPLDHIYCIDSAYIENGVLERKGENLYRILPANGKSVTKNYFQYWEPEESSEGPTSFYLPLPEKKSIFSIFPSAFAQTPEPASEDPEEAPVGAALVGEEFLTTPENLTALDDELEELADEELEETIPEVPEFPPPGQDGFPPPGQDGGPIGEIPQVGGPEGGRATGQTGAFAQTSCGKATKLDGSASLIFISNFLIGFLLTIFRRRK